MHFEDEILINISLVVLESIFLVSYSHQESQTAGLKMVGYFGVGTGQKKK